MNAKLLKCIVAEGADDARHKATPAIRLRQPVAELRTMSICREGSDDTDGTNEVARWRAESEVRHGRTDGLLAAVEPTVGIGLGVGERNGQQVPSNLRVGEVLQIRSLIGSHDATKVELVGDFEADAFIFVHRTRRKTHNDKSRAAPNQKFPPAIADLKA